VSGQRQQLLQEMARAPYPGLQCRQPSATLPRQFGMIEILGLYAERRDGAA